MAVTLAQTIEHAAVPFEDLDRDYKPMMALVQELIGVVPNCDPILEIWPTGFRTYNLFVANLLNLPGSLFGQGAAKDLVGLAMYTASRAAECMYCSAHTCSFALRRGATPESLTGNYNEVERAVANLAESIASVPSYCTLAHVAEVERYMSRDDIDWLVLSVGMMGFLNKFMDTMGIELEEAAIGDVQDLISQTGWSVGKHGGWSSEIDEGFEVGGQPLRRADGVRHPSGFRRPFAAPGAGHDQYQVNGPTINGPTINGQGDHGYGDHGSNGDLPGYAYVPVDNVRTYLRVLRQAPGALRRERRWTKGLSGRLGPALVDLESQVGYSFPLLASIAHNKPVRAIAAALRENLDPSLTSVGLDAKLLVGLVYAKVVGNEMLVAEAVQLAELLVPDLNPNLMAAVGRFAATEGTEAVLPPGLTAEQTAAVMLAKAGAPSPSTVNEITIEMVSRALSPSQVVEVVVWLSVQQLLHRLYVYYDAVNEIG